MDISTIARPAFERCCTATENFFLYAQNTIIVCLRRDSLEIDHYFQGHAENVVWIEANNHTKGDADRVVASSDKSAVVIFWNLLTGKEIARRTARDNRAAAWMTNGKMALGSSEGTVEILEPNSKYALSVETIWDSITALAPAMDCQTFGIGYANGSILVAKVSPEFTILNSLNRGSLLLTTVNGLAWHRTSLKQKSDMLVSQTRDGVIRVWSIPRKHNGPGATVIRHIAPQGAYGPVWFAWSQQGRLVAFVSGVTNLWDVRTKKVTFESVPTVEGILGMAIHGPSAILYTIGKNHTFQQYNLNPSSAPMLVHNIQHLPSNDPPPLAIVAPDRSEIQDKAAVRTRLSSPSEMEALFRGLQLPPRRSQSVEVQPRTHEDNQSEILAVASPSSIRSSSRSPLRSNSRSSLRSNSRSPKSSTRRWNTGPISRYAAESFRSVSGNNLSKASLLYKPLSFRKSEIRLIKVNPATSKDTLLTCILWPVPLRTAPSFTALSYHWGDTSKTVPMEVNGIEYQATVNLDAALRRLRAEGVYTIWADALCINQRDNEEKSLQVPRIGAIFRKAYEVAVWLGEDHGIDTKATEVLCSGRPLELGQDTCRSSLLVFRHLLDRPYWRRVWIIQELAVASRISVYCGRYRIPWQALDTTCPCCDKKSPTGARGCLEHDGSYSFTMLRGVRRDVLSRRPIALLDALRRTRSSLATDPRDKIFALLGLSFDGSHFVPEPSYMDSVSSSFTDFATELMKSNEGMDFIYLRSANRKVDERLPSWVPDWTDMNDAVTRRQLDYIMDHLSHRTRFSEVITNRGAPNIDIQGAELSVDGILFDTISYLGSALTTDGEPILPINAATSVKLASPYKSEEDISYVIAETLFSTQVFDNEPLKSWSTFIRDFHRHWRQAGLLRWEATVFASIPQSVASQVCTWLVENRSFIIHGRTIESWTRLHSESRNGNQSAEHQRQFLRTVRSRMRLLMTERGYLGWAHPRARKGDRIALITGCSRPVILRAYQDSYRVVGDACLSGQTTAALWEIVARDEVEKLRIL